MTESNDSNTAFDTSRPKVDLEYPPDLRGALVWSRHRQAMTDPGSLEVVARAGDGVIEAIASTQRPMYLGVQWHPERTDDRQMGMGLFHRLVDQARGGNG